MSWNDDLIAKLPERLQPVAGRLIDFWLNRSLEEIEILSEHMAAGDWEFAYRMMLAEMSNEDLAAESDRINSGLAALNKENAQSMDAQRAMVRDLLLIGLAMARQA
ncbi:MAG: hypothetical protein LLF76_03105 [Planctomycetaceae bacterium]|nr:hypothetical protein [Planctomycetaceae bacterium]